MSKKELKLGQVLLKDVRLSFAQIWHASSVIPGSAPKYSANFIIDPSTPQGKASLKAAQAAVEAVERDKFKRKDIKYKEGRLALKEGNEQVSSSTGEVYAGYEDMMVVSAGSRTRFPIIDRDRTPLTEDDGKPYSGCYVNALVQFYAVDGADKGGRGVFAGIDAIQFVREGESFGAGAVNTDDYFDDLGFSEGEDDDIPF